MNIEFEQLREFLNKKVEQYNTPSFIQNDPIVIPHSFQEKQDIEIMGFFASIFAWGLRKTIINKCTELSERFGNQPYQFILNYKDQDLQKLTGFKHRTFNDTDLLYFVDFLHRHYTNHNSLEDAFLPGGKFTSIESSLVYFEENFFNHPNAPQRTRKHVATPSRNSTCKRLNMFLRWMVREDAAGVDFGIWKRIPQSALICPIDVHVERTARRLGLVARPQVDWQTALELSANLRQLDEHDPVKYDFALFGISIEKDVDIYTQ